MMGAPLTIRLEGRGLPFYKAGHLTAVAITDQRKEDRFTKKSTERGGNGPI
jgi:hypothetical protein